MKDKEIVKRIVNSPYSWELTIKSIEVPEGLEYIRDTLLNIASCKRYYRDYHKTLSIEYCCRLMRIINKKYAKVNQFRFKHWDFRELNIKFKN